jgi:hypothetical protein
VVIAHVRNAHPTKRMAIPLGGGWARLLYPGVTTAVPERALHTPLARQLLTAKLIELADGAAWDADVRQRRAARTDMARAIAAAEQAEFNRLLRGVRVSARRPASPPPVRQPRVWTTEREALLRERHASGAGVAQIAAELGLTASAVQGHARRLGLGSPRTWTEEREARLRRLWQDGAHWSVIAGELGISRAQMFGKSRMLGLGRRYVRVGAGLPPATPAAVTELTLSP